LLQALNLSNSVIGVSGLERIARGLAHCRQLRHLNLSNNPLGSGGMEELASALSHRLEHLSIFNALLDHKAVQRLAANLHCPNLTVLNLSWNRIGSEGCKALARSLRDGSCPNLTSLNISHNYIQVRGGVTHHN
jgi:Ran GTPase-activating protein (RanGAP) involved in mRNA processing and transport